MDQPIDTNTREDEITLRQFVADLRKAKLMFVLLLGALTLGGVLIGLLVPRNYSASIVLSPVSEGLSGSRLGGLAELASQYSGLASLAGINLPESGMKDEAIAVLQSQLLTQRYIQQNNLLPVLYASNWNAATHTWKSRDRRHVP